MDASSIEAGGWKGDWRPQVAAIRAVVCVGGGSANSSIRRGAGTAGSDGSREEGILACGGWVLCADQGDGERHLTGEEVVPAPPTLGRGGFRIEAVGTVESSYLAELAGAVDVLRSLMECVTRERVLPGKVHHWCDNLSVVRLIREMDVLPRRYWRARPCRHLWAEMQQRLQWWRSRGGEWDTSWVKGHVDRDDRRAPATYTVAEQLNMQADALATKECESAVARPRTPHPKALSGGDSGRHLAGT